MNKINLNSNSKSQAEARNVITSDAIKTFNPLHWKTISLQIQNYFYSMKSVPILILKDNENTLLQLLKDISQVFLETLKLTLKLKYLCSCFNILKMKLGYGYTYKENIHDAAFLMKDLNTFIQVKKLYKFRKNLFSR